MSDERVAPIINNELRHYGPDGIVGPHDFLRITLIGGEHIYAVPQDQPVLPYPFALYWQIDLALMPIELQTIMDEHNRPGVYVVDRPGNPTRVGEELELNFMGGFLREAIIFLADMPIKSFTPSRRHHMMKPLHLSGTYAISRGASI